MDNGSNQRDVAGWPGGISLDAVQIYFSECMGILAQRKELRQFAGRRNDPLAGNSPVAAAARRLRLLS